MPLQPNYVANGNILPSRFVKIDTTYTAGNRVIQCTATTDIPVGISQPGTIYPAGTPAYTSNANAAVKGDDCMLFQPTETGKLELGDTVAVGDYLGPDSSGRGVTVTSGTTGARAQQAGVLGDIIEVYVITGFTMKFPVIQASGRQTGQTGTIASLATYTVGAQDGSFRISGNVNITAETVGTLQMKVAWTDETGASQLGLVCFTQAGSGTLITTLVSIEAYQSVPTSIRAQAGSTITVSVPVVPGITFNAEAYIEQLG